MFGLSQAFYWFLIGIFFLVLEVSFIQGVGFLFAGCAAFTVFLLLEIKVITVNFTEDVFYFFMLTIAWGAILWWPLKRFGASKTARKFANIIGTTAVVCNERLREGELGYVKWSRMKIRAHIVPGAINHNLSVGTKVLVVDVKGDIIYVKKK
jgi:membrane protein implicated in regulation of membrane protease activity